MAASLRVSHSHMTRTRQPRLCSASTFRRSRKTFLRNFSCQNRTRVLGEYAYWHPGCLCQKQPCTKIAAWRRGKTRSGRPGRSLRWRRKRKPKLWAIRRTTISGVVSRPLILDMISLLRLLSTMSIIRPTQNANAELSFSLLAPDYSRRLRLFHVSASLWFANSCTRSIGIVPWQQSLARTLLRTPFIGPMHRPFCHRQSLQLARGHQLAESEE